MDSHDKQLISAHIESMNNLTRSIHELVNAVALLVDAGMDQEDAEELPGQRPLLMNGKPY
jgi:hypothetical protein